MAKTSLALPGFYVLGVVTIGQDVINSGGIALATAFPNEAIGGESVSTIIFSTHETNGASALIYVGDLTMTSSPATTAAYTLKGPNVVDSTLSNMGGNNTIPLGNTKLNSDTVNSKVRVSVLVS